MKKYIKPEITVINIETESLLQVLSADSSETNDKNRAPHYGRFYDEEDEDVI